MKRIVLLLRAEQTHRLCPSLLPNILLRLSPRRQLPATGAHTETRSLKSIPLKGSFKKKNPKTKTNKQKEENRRSKQHQAENERISN